ncbi:MAG: glycoside hydrolase family 25 protein [Oscillospiraceae bacterium]|nr:glycoside hydrolase family 25 protein [Oscillospiraceae bacterium]
MEFKGIDVSKHNGRIDWERVKKSGVEFAILRAGFGRENPRQVDVQFERNYSECRRLGIPVGAYHYSYAKNPDGAQKELDFFLKLIDGKQFDYPLCFDIEDESLNGISEKVLTDNVLTFCKGLEERGYYAAVYCNMDWLKNRLEHDRLKDIDLWLAYWSNARSENIKVGMWQYSEKGQIDGISGDVDLDIAYKNYPEIIRSKGMNNFGKNHKYVVAAEKSGMDLAEAEALSSRLRDLNMSVSKREDRQ